MTKEQVFFITKLYDRYFNRLLKKAYSFSNQSVVEADDIVFDIFIKIMENRELLEKIRDMKKPLPYLYTMVHYAGIDYIKDKKKEDNTHYYSMNYRERSVNPFSGINAKMDLLVIKGCCTKGQEAAIEVLEEGYELKDLGVKRDRIRKAIERARKKLSGYKNL